MKIEIKCPGFTYTLIDESLDNISPTTPKEIVEKIKEMILSEVQYSQLLVKNTIWTIKIHDKN